MSVYIFKFYMVYLMAFVNHIQIKKKFFLDKEKFMEHKTEHELNVINSFETALVEHHNMSHNELLQQTEILSELPSQQQQPVIVRPPSTKLPRMLLDTDGMYFFYFCTYFYS